MADGEIGVAGGPAVPGEKRSCVRSTRDGMGYSPTLPSRAHKPGHASQITLATSRTARHKSKAAGGTDKVHEKDRTT
jgi:hypothetical protein